jgi:hypothetical protein
MGRVKIFASFLSIACFVFPLRAALGQTLLAGRASDSKVTRSLFTQSAVEKLSQDFTSDDISYLLLDAHTGAVLASRWPESDRPIPLGSLVKPFTALAYAQRHRYKYPVYTCHGTASRCWRARPHGQLNIVSALANSCNSYFLEVASQLSGTDMHDVASEFGLDSPGDSLTGSALMGLGEDWAISPLHMARAYLELNRRRADPGIAEILRGLERSAQSGTGSGVGNALKHSSALVKTGTAVCRHAHRAPGDGFVVALVPNDQPLFLLMVRAHGVPGAVASVIAGRMLARLEQ